MCVVVRLQNGASTDFTVNGSMSTDELKELLQKKYGITSLNQVSFQDNAEVQRSPAPSVGTETTSITSVLPSQLLRSQWDLTLRKFEQAEASGDKTVTYIHSPALSYYLVIILNFLEARLNRHIYLQQIENDAAVMKFKSRFNPDFVPSDAYTGSRPGYVFTTGEKGLGYYLDKPVAVQLPRKAPRYVFVTIFSEK